MISKLFTIAACMLIGSCDTPHRGVVVVREADHYLVSLLNCGDPKWDNPPVWELNVGKFHSGQPIDIQCKLFVSFEQSDGGSGRLTQWRYGSQPKGYVLAQCAALESGTTYEVNVAARPGLAKGHFTVDGSGEVNMIDGPCRK